jgi:hypothetical protein
MDFSEQIENEVKKYFNTKPLFTVTKLDTGKIKSADFRIEYQEKPCFLCEVKAISSVHSNFPKKPINYYQEKRNDYRKSIDIFKKKNPQKKTIMTPDQYSFIFGNENDFQRKYNNLQRFTEKHFNDFADELKNFLLSSEKTKDLPYTIRIDSDDLYYPSKSEKHNFFQWIENEIVEIHNGNISYVWSSNQFSTTLALFTFKVMKINNGNNIRSEYQINIEQLQNQNKLQIHIHSYGGLNERAINQEIEKAVGQLRKSVEREKNKKIPRIITLAFISDFSFHESDLIRIISEQLKFFNKDLSAIVIFQNVRERTLIMRKDENLFDWFTRSTSLNLIPGFIVIHNSWLVKKEISSLDLNIFDSNDSFQISPLKSLFI